MKSNRMQDRLNDVSRFRTIAEASENPRVKQYIQAEADYLKTNKRYRNEKRKKRY